MPNIIRIKNLEKETNLTGAIFPIDKNTYHSIVKQVSFEDLKLWLFSGYTCVEDIDFYYNDVTPGVSQTYYIDISATFDYRIVAIILKSESSMDNINIQINGISVEWLINNWDNSTLIYSNTNITTFKPTSLNDVTTYNQVTLETNGAGTSTKIFGKMRIIRTSSCDKITPEPEPPYPYYYVSGNEPIGLGNLL